MGYPAALLLLSQDHTVNDCQGDAGTQARTSSLGQELDLLNFCPLDSALTGLVLFTPGCYSADVHLKGFVGTECWVPNEEEQGDILTLSLHSTSQGSPAAHCPAFPHTDDNPRPGEAILINLSPIWR